MAAVTLRPPAVGRDEVKLRTEKTRSPCGDQHWVLRERGILRGPRLRLDRYNTHMIDSTEQSIHPCGVNLRIHF